MSYQSNMLHLKDLLRYGHIISLFDDSINGASIRVIHLYVKTIMGKEEYKAVLVNGTCVFLDMFK